MALPRPLRPYEVSLVKVFSLCLDPPISLLHDILDDVAVVTWTNIELWCQEWTAYARRYRLRRLVLVQSPWRGIAGQIIGLAIATTQLVL